MEPDQQLRNLRDFLLVYNRMTEICFQRCSSNFNYRSLTMDEERCVDNCAGKLIRSNHRLMGTYVQLMPSMMQRRMEEMENKLAENAKATEAIGAGNTESSEPAVLASSNVPEGLQAVEVPITLSPASDVATVISPSIADVAVIQKTNVSELGADIPTILTLSPTQGEAMMKPLVSNSDLKPTELDAAGDLGLALSPQITENRVTAAIPHTHTTEMVNYSVETQGVNELASTTVPPQLSPVITPQPSLPPIDVNIESRNSVLQSLETLPVLTQPKLLPLSEQPAVSSAAAPSLSQATDSLPNPEKTP